MGAICGSKEARYMKILKHEADVFIDPILQEGCTEEKKFEISVGKVMAYLKEKGR